MILCYFSVQCLCYLLPSIKSNMLSMLSPHLYASNTSVHHSSIVFAWSKAVQQKDGLEITLTRQEQQY